MPSDVSLSVLGDQDAPVTYTVPGAQEIIVKACQATFDGTDAVGSFLPIVQFVSPAGRVIATAQGPAIAAGSIGDVSFFPHVAAAASSSGSGIQYDTYPQSGDWLYSETTGEGGPNGAGVDFEDTGSGGIRFVASNTGYVIINANGQGDVNIGVNGDLTTIAGDSVQLDGQTGIVSVDNPHGTAYLYEAPYGFQAVASKGLMLLGLPPAPGAAGTLWSNGGVVTVA